MVSVRCDQGVTIVTGAVLGNHEVGAQQHPAISINAETTEVVMFLFARKWGCEPNAKRAYRYWPKNAALR